MTPKIDHPVSVPERRDPRIAEELIRRASEGCEGPLDAGCWQTKLPMHLWCDPCRCQEAAKEIKLLAALLAAPSPAPQGEVARLEQERDHERHEKETVADAMQAYGRWSKVERGRLEATVASLREALRTFGEHTSRCAVRSISGKQFPDCNCGFAAALADPPRPAPEAQ
jgi:hypothetical protein